MKLLAFSSLLLWFFHSYSCPAQVQAVKGAVNFPKLKQYVATVRLTGQKEKVSGVLFNLTDSSVVLAPTGGLKPKIKALVNQNGGALPSATSLSTALLLRTVKYGEIERVSLHRRGAVARDLSIGIGFGALIGLLMGSDPPEDAISFSTRQKAVAFGVIGGVACTGFDLVSIRTIDAQKQSVATEMQERLLNYAIVEQLKKATIATP